MRRLHGYGLKVKWLSQSKIFLKSLMYILFVLLFITIYQEMQTASYFTLLLLCLVFSIIVFKQARSFKNMTEFKPCTSEKKYIQAFENTGIYAKLDSNFNIINANRNFYQIMHMVKNQAEVTNLFELIDEDTQEIKETIKYKQVWDGQIIFHTLDKTTLHFNASFTPIFNDDDELKECLFIANDVTDLIVSKSNVKKHLYMDSLTKLPNRLSLFTEKKFSQNSYATYIIFNIDSFESLNSLYGNEFGDKVLLKMSQWLSLNLPIAQGVKLYKFEADIYTAVIYSEFSLQDLKNYLTNITKKIAKEKFAFDEVEIDITMTIGAAQAKSDQLKLAQIAYKEAKIAKNLSASMIEEVKKKKSTPKISKRSST